jgi:hypothetical protein
MKLLFAATVSCFACCVFAGAQATYSYRTFDLSDHFKSGQRLSFQNRPTGLAVQD